MWEFDFNGKYHYRPNWMTLQFCYQLTLGHTRTVISPPCTRGGGGVEPLPRVFDMLQYFETILPSVESFDLVDKLRYILCVLALLEVFDVTKHGCHLPSWILSTIRNQVPEWILTTLPTITTQPPYLNIINNIINMKPAIWTLPQDWLNGKSLQT